MSLYVSARKYGPQVCDGYMILSLALPSILNSFCKEIWTLGVGWCRLLTNICKLLGDSFWTMDRTLNNFYFPPYPQSTGGGMGGYRVTYLLQTFDPPSKCKSSGARFLTWGGLTYMQPSPSGKNTKGDRRGQNCCFYIF